MYASNLAPDAVSESKLDRANIPLGYDQVETLTHEVGHWLNLSTFSKLDVTKWRQVGKFCRYLHHLDLSLFAVLCFT